MKKITPYIFGVVLYLFLAYGLNADLIKNNSILNISLIAIGTILLYTFTLSKIDNSKIFKAGIAFYVVYFFRLFIFPFILVGYKYYFDVETKKAKKPKSLIEKKQIDFVTDFNQCKNLKYGTFLREYDTVIRFKKSGQDYEHIINDQTTTFLIKWLDDCTYMHINEINNSVINIIKIGNFDEDFHYLYVKPATLHEISDETIFKTKKITATNSGS